MLTDYGQHVCTCCMGLGVPSGPLDWYLPIGMQRLGQQRHTRVATAPTGRGALDGAIRPLPRRFEAQMGATLLAGGCNAPAFDELVHHGAGLIVAAGRDVGTWLQTPCRIAHEYPAEGQHGLANPSPIRQFRWSRPADGGRWSQRTRTRGQGVWASLSPCLSCGSRAPLTRGRPLVPGRRGGAGTDKAASSRSGATKRTPQWAQTPPHSCPLSVWSPMRVISTPGHQRRTASSIWRARCGTV